MTQLFEESTVLIVEDNPKIVIFLTDTLESMGFQVLVARNGFAGLEIAQKQKPNLIILDVMMPGIDGYEVCDRLKNDPKTMSIPILMLTAKGQKKEIVKGLKLGADDYLPKPYDEMELQARIEVLLRRYPTGKDKDPGEIGQSNAIDTKKLFCILVEFFSIDEIRTLCFKLDIDFDLISGEGKDNIVRELLLFLKRRGQVNRLVKLVQDERPNINLNQTQ